MWLLFAILTVLLWGTSDVIFKSASGDDPESAPKLLAYNGLVLGGCSIVYMLIIRYPLSLSGLVAYIPIAAVYIASMFFYYKALPLIKISIESPLANSSCVLTTLLCVFVLKQQVNAWQAAAIAMIVTAIVLLSLDKRGDGAGEKLSRDKRGVYLLGVALSLLYFLLDGLGSFLDENILEETLGAEQVIISYGLIYMAVGIVCRVYLKFKEPSFRLRADARKLTGSLIETAGQFTYIYTYAFGDAAIASPFIASFSVVSVLLSRLFLKEKLRAPQYILIAMMLLGMAILGIE